LFLCTIDLIQCGTTSLHVSILSTLVTSSFAIDIDLLSLYDWLCKLLLLRWLLGLRLLLLPYLLRILRWNLLRGDVPLIASSAHLFDMPHFLACFTLQVVCPACLGQMSFPGTLGTLYVIDWDVIVWCVSVRHLIIYRLCLIWGGCLPLTLLISSDPIVGFHVCPLWTLCCYVFHLLTLIAGWFRLRLSFQGNCMDGCGY